MIWHKKLRCQKSKKAMFTKQAITKRHPISYFFLSCLFLGLGLFNNSVWANSGQSATFKGFAETIVGTFVILQGIMVVAAYAAGVGFAIIGLLKFKAHKDNPAQIPLSTPIALIAVSAGLLFMPTVFEIAGNAVFGDAAKKSPVIDKIQSKMQ